MDKMISCDWGTSSFRIRLVNNSDLSILATRSSAQGILTTHALWSGRAQGGGQSQGQPLQGDRSRLSFYQSILGEAILDLGKELGLSLDGVPVVISGMASSSLGMLELPYKELPFFADGSDLRVETLYAHELFKHNMLVISGVKTGDDVMRGEETQLVGCESGLGGERVIIFPGTHSKHVLLGEGRVISFKTYMTGEFFELLSKKSILAGDVETREVGEAGERGAAGFHRIMEEFHATRFEEGVREGVEGNLLHGAFLVRMNRLLRGISKKENHDYLSGLLIGAELKELVGGNPSLKEEAGRKPALMIVGEEALCRRYVTALGILGLDGVRVLDGGEAVVRGQVRIMQAKGHNRLSQK
jgi:2-dehydro-3-deoxygalactonokinase